MSELGMATAEINKSNADSAYQNWREGFIVTLLVGSLTIGLFALIPALINRQRTLLDAIFISIYVSVLIITLIRFPYLVRVYVFLHGIYILGISDLLSPGGLGNGHLFFLALIVLATIMLSPLAGIVATVISIGTYGIIGWLTTVGVVTIFSSNGSIANLQDWISASATTVLFAITIILGFRHLQNEVQSTQSQVIDKIEKLDREKENFEKAANEGLEGIQKANEISRSLSTILDFEELIALTVSLISGRYNCYFTALFIMNPSKRWLDLIGATGETGKVLKENNYRLDMDGKSLIVNAIKAGTARLAGAGEDTTPLIKNPLLPYTRSELALPLIVDGEMIGALDLHSSKDSEFEKHEINALQGLASQIAIAIRNARLFQESQQTLKELRGVQRNYLETAWKSLTSEKAIEFQIGDEGSSENINAIEVPLSLRDQIIGQISLSGDSEWSAEQRTMIESIATQAALALENARLVEESQSSATHERLAVDITSKVWASSSTEAILQTTVQELGRALSASRATIELKLDTTNE